jgi:hypothetical protein
MMTSKQNTELKPLSDYAPHEKVAWFDETYNDAIWYLEYLETHGHESKDCEHYTFEWCMELLGDNVWKRWNAVEQLY